MVPPRSLAALLESGVAMKAQAGGSSAASAGVRILVVEDELMISMLVEDMLAELGYQVVGVAASLEEASRLAREVEFDGALLDVNLNGKKVDAVAQTLAVRNIPFVFT